MSLGDGQPEGEALTDRRREALLRGVPSLPVEGKTLFEAELPGERRYRMLARAVWRIQEDERRRISRELHDGVGQALTALANQLQRIADDAKAHSNLGLAHRLADALDITRSALHDTRELSRLLRPTLLDDLGLEAALGWLARTLGERSGVTVSVGSQLGDRRLPADVETIVYRITQEALTNVIRHARASQASVSLSVLHPRLRLEVSDDGCGFDPLRLQSPEVLAQHVGVRGMRDRAELYGGSLELTSAPGRGTTVRLLLPIADPGGADHTHPTEAPWA